MFPRNFCSQVCRNGRRISQIGFTILEALLMLVLLSAFSMLSIALWIKSPSGTNEEELKWRSEGGDAMKLSPTLPAVEDSDLLPEMTSDTEIQLEKDAPATKAP